MYYYEVLVANKYAKHAYVYSSEEVLTYGTVIELRFGKQRAYGVVVKILHNPAVEKNTVKSIDRIFPYIIPETMVSFLSAAAEYNVLSVGSVLEMALPTAALKPKTLGKLDTKLDAKTKLQSEITELTLSSDQVQCVDQIKAMQHGTMLLEGVTGSGKTIVALQGIINRAKKGKVLIIVPEIALSKNWVDSLSKHFDMPAFVYHHKITAAKKRDLFAWAVSDATGLIIGARSALFLPYCNLQAIVIDEEHAVAHKQENYPRYNARDMSILKAHHEKIPCVLLSATPSLEVQYNIAQGKYQHAQLDRTPKHGLAEFAFVKQEKMQILAPKIIELMAETFKNKMQVLLFLNRKGYAPYCMCNLCYKTIKCHGCDLPMIFYANHQVVCHKCGVSKRLPVACPSCSQNTTWKFHGVGVEKLQEFIEPLFPEQKFCIVTSDTKEIDQHIDDFNSKKIDCLIATQVLAHGHDFKNIALAVIVDADMGLNSPDFRASEKMFQLWQQMRGRSGRHEHPGKLLIQSENEDNRFFKLFKSTDPSNELMAERRASHFPPFTRCAFIILKSRNYNNTNQLLQNLRLEIHGAEIYGPRFVGKQNNIYEWRFLLKIARDRVPHVIIQAVASKLPKIKGLTLEFDVDPYSFV